MFKFYLFILTFLTITSSVASAQEEGLKSISTDELRRHLEIIASDSLAGRNFLTDERGLEWAADYIKKQAQTLGLKPAVDNYTQNFTINVGRQNDVDTFAAKNIIGFIEGSDPVLKDECVVFMAHYDHLGINESGEIFNGADDNGSGIVALFEIADAFQSLEEKPARSIVFLWVTGEEIGLFGSAYYAENPVFPLDKTVTCINLDMIGRVREPRDSVWQESPKWVREVDGVFVLISDFYPPLKSVTDSVTATLGLVPDKSLPDRFFRASDQYHFHRNGVPILNLSTGYHADYHKITDEISRINFEKMKRVTDLAFLVGHEISNIKSQ